MTIRTRKFYDFSIHTAPECSDSPEAMAETAAGYGYAGIAITSHTPHQPQKPEMTNHPKIAAYPETEIVAENPHHPMQMIRKHRAKVRMFSMHGGNEKVNRTEIFSNRIFSDYAEANSSTNLCKG
ncbi:MAG: RNase P subunit p30 family protein [Euryarchaeota archaeon]|nr:RNase P subunit p30 family protein [Euryarchaeota archaeon]